MILASGVEQEIESASRGHRAEGTEQKQHRAEGGERKEPPADQISSILTLFASDREQSGAKIAKTGQNWGESDQNLAKTGRK